MYYEFQEPDIIDVFKNVSISEATRIDIPESFEESDGDLGIDEEDLEYSTFKILRFIDSVYKLINKDYPYYKDIKLDACINYEYPNYLYESRNLRRLRLRLDLAVNIIVKDA